MSPARCQFQGSSDTRFAERIQQELNSGCMCDPFGYAHCVCLYDIVVERTDGGGLNHVADGESLDGLVLGGASRAVGAADGLDVATALLVTAAVRLLALPHLQAAAASEFRGAW